MQTASATATNTQRVIQREEWRAIHNQSAETYKTAEFFRETMLGTGKLRRTLFAQATGHVLDVACGYGSNFRYLKQATRITGVDFSPVMLALAQTQTQHLPIPIELYSGEAEALNFPDETFDTVISALATCSLLDPVQALREMRRVCKPTGRILLLEYGRSQCEQLGQYQDHTVAQMIEQGGCRWNQEPQQLIQAAGLTIRDARRSLAGIYHLLDVQ